MGKAPQHICTPTIARSLATQQEQNIMAAAMASIDAGEASTDVASKTCLQDCGHDAGLFAAAERCFGPLRRVTHAARLIADN
jgi:hypothetical protein